MGHAPADPKTSSACGKRDANLQRNHGGIMMQANLLLIDSHFFHRIRSSSWKLAKVEKLTNIEGFYSILYSVFLTRAPTVPL